MSGDLRRPRLAGHARRRADPVAGTPLLLYPEGAIELDETAAAIVDRCDGTATVAGIAEQLALLYDGDPAEIAGDVAACLDGLASRGLVVFAGPEATP
ncbi:MAG TPA: pyrroloquinoline quinone biosynthesis peptide chaperone PqqD [Candidatus Methylacidiphilales bacterium]